jgi:hypothetical protein
VGVDGQPTVIVATVSADYFRVLGSGLYAGRPFSASDTQGREQVIMVNESAMKLVGVTVNTVGQTMGWSAREGWPTPRLVGIARDALQQGPEAAAQPTFYLPMAQRGGPSRDTDVIVRVNGGGSAVMKEIRNVMQRIDPSQPIPRMTSLQETFYDTIAPRRFSFAVATAFAVAGGFLAMLGLYGTMSYVVAQRTNEIGIREALGADRRMIMRFVFREGRLLIAAGVVLGLLGSLAAVRLLQGLLYQMSSYDPLIFGAAALLLAGTALIACVLPARRAATLDPVTAMRA